MATGSHPALHQEPEALLWAAWTQRRDPAAREQLVARHAGLVRSIAASIYRSGSLGYVSFSELVQQGSVGLLEAIGKYDPSAGASFAAYASKRIRGEIVGGLDQSSEVHAQLAFRRRLKRERTASLAEGAKTQHGSDVFLQMVEVALGLAVGHMLEGTSMYVDDSAARISEEPTPIRHLGQSLLKLIEQLPDAERRVIRYHYLDGISFTAVAELMRLSKGRISQLHAKALKSLRLLHHNRQRIDLEI